MADISLNRPQITGVYYAKTDTYIVTLHAAHANAPTQL